MSALTQAGLLGKCLQRHKSEFKLGAFGVTLCFMLGRAFPVYAQQQEPRYTEGSPLIPEQATQLSTMKAELKMAEEKAQAAQQNADLAVTQRSAMEAKLKKMEDERLTMPPDRITTPQPDQVSAITGPVSYPLARALDAIQRQQRYIEALEERVKELENELAALKAQKQ
jgi:hypothetical protein